MRITLSRSAGFGHRFTAHQVLSSACAFLAFTTIAGGIGLIGGSIRPGDELLRGSPFDSYLIPGLILLIVVGGSALTATVLLVIGHPAAAFEAAGAGMMMMCYELVEVWVIGSPSGIARNLQIFYLLLGAAVAGIAMVSRETLKG